MKYPFFILFAVFMLVSCSKKDNYYAYLNKAYSNPSTINTNSFYDKAISFWMTRVDTLEEHSYTRNDTLRLFLNIQDSIRKNEVHTPLRFADEIQRFTEYDSENTIINNPILFIGSSTVNLWKTAKHFPNLNVLNRGFGGAGIKDILYYYDTVIGKYSPSSVVIYDDIEIENGNSVDSVFHEFKRLSTRIHDDFPECRIIFISTKPTPMDFLLGKNVRHNKLELNYKLKSYANTHPLIEYADLAHLLYNADGTLNINFFSDDRMHFNENGYKCWSKELNKLYLNY